MNNQNNVYINKHIQNTYMKCLKNFQFLVACIHKCISSLITFCVNLYAYVRSEKSLYTHYANLFNALNFVSGAFTYYYSLNALFI